MPNSRKSNKANLWVAIRRELRWLIPGIGVKRWILMIIVGTTIVGLGIAVMLVDIYRNVAPDSILVPFMRAIALQGLNRFLRGIIYGFIGLACIGLGIWGLNRALLKPFVKPGTAVLDKISRYSRKEKGPKIVAIGGGNGLATLLRGLKLHTNNITAIVTVADDGGSSGEIRRKIGILPPGDIRNCLAALSDDEEMISQIFQYRFAETAGLNGHSLGNLLITALTEITGSFEEAVAESGRVLAIHGKVIPATLHNVRLAAVVQKDGEKGEVKIEGESQIPAAGGKIKRVWLEPNNPEAFPPALQAILSADLVVIGPGSLFTSLLPPLLVPNLVQALRASKAMKFFVCNVATQVGETSGFSCDEHVSAIEKHIGHYLFDVVITNNVYEGTLSKGVDWVKASDDFQQHYQVYQSNLIDVNNPWHHDKTKLANAILDLYLEKTGPLGLRIENKKG